MNYSRIYDALMERAHGRVLVDYTEDHHIVPKCLGGSDDKANLVALTAEEHFLAHQLLVKIHPDNAHLALAVKLMTTTNGRQVRNNKEFSWLRKRANEANRLIMMGNKNLLGHRHSDETKKRMSDARRGVKRGPNKRPLSAETRAKMAAAQKLRRASER